MDLDEAICRIYRAMNEVEPTSLDDRLMSELEKSLYADADSAGALEWAEGFATYLEAA